MLRKLFNLKEKILPDQDPKKQYEFATSFLKVGDYPTAERAFREFVLENPEHELAGNAQYWYAETFRIRQLYTDAASAYLEGYQKYPKGEKAPINLLKLGVSMVQIGEKDQGCKMINGVEKQYPEANQSVIQKAKYESQSLNAIRTHKILSKKITNNKIKNLIDLFDKKLDISSNFAVAVSGGPDSLALAYLSKIYSIKKKLKIKYLIVDHKLRKNSTNEAKNIKKNLKNMGAELKFYLGMEKNPKQIFKLWREKKI